MSKLVGTVLQDTDGQFIGLTVAEDIAFALENECTGQTEMRQRVDDTARELDLEMLLNHAPGELSRGQKQRVSMAGFRKMITRQLLSSNTDWKMFCIAMWIV